MIQLIKSYRLVKWIDKSIREEDRKDPNIAIQGRKPRLSGNQIMKSYSKIRHISPSEARNLIEYCVAKGYLDREIDVGGAWLYISHNQGRELIEPLYIGFVLECLKRYNPLFIVLGTILFSGIVRSLLQIIWQTLF